jgi:hypothetical protein
MAVYKVDTKNEAVFYITATNIQTALHIVEKRLFDDYIVLIQDMGENSEILYE